MNLKKLINPLYNYLILIKLIMFGKSEKNTEKTEEL